VIIATSITFFTVLLLTQLLPLLLLLALKPQNPSSWAIKKTRFNPQKNKTPIKTSKTLRVVLFKPFLNPAAIALFS